MHLTQVQDHAIQARMALIAGIRFDELDGYLLYAFAKDEETAAEIEDNYALHIATIAGGILQREVEVVLVLPKVLQ